MSHIHENSGMAIKEWIMPKLRITYKIFLIAPFKSCMCQAFASSNGWIQFTIIKMKQFSGERLSRIFSLRLASIINLSPFAAARLAKMREKSMPVWLNSFYTVCTAAVLLIRTIFFTNSGSDFWKRPDPDPQLNKFSAKFLLEIF
jgi:hypothetical protein